MSTFVAAGESPVAAPERDAADGIFGDVVVRFEGGRRWRTASKQHGGRWVIARGQVTQLHRQDARAMILSQILSEGETYGDKARGAYAARE